MGADGGIGGTVAEMLAREGMLMPEEIAQLVCLLLSCRGNAVIDERNVHRANKEPFPIL